ncbi:unnamed protein product [Symbiodinium natans]|uniref:Uncharacterized protein n=1 Tax=Symbiodinium natans TaxID=878477 RepID=A0A812USG5_9DINO|nr:unnamed protein product [Symbiodinium natans]
MLIGSDSEVQELLDSINLTGTQLREEEFLRIMAAVRDMELESIAKVLKLTEATTGRSRGIGLEPHNFVLKA